MGVAGGGALENALWSADVTMDAMRTGRARHHLDDKVVRLLFEGSVFASKRASHDVESFMSASMHRHVRQQPCPSISTPHRTRMATRSQHRDVMRRANEGGCLPQRDIAPRDVRSVLNTWLHITPHRWIAQVKLDRVARRIRHTRSTRPTYRTYLLQDNFGTHDETYMWQWHGVSCVI